MIGCRVYNPYQAVYCYLLIIWAFGGKAKCKTHLLCRCSVYGENNSLYDLSSIMCYWKKSISCKCDDI